MFITLLAIFTFFTFPFVTCLASTNIDAGPAIIHVHDNPSLKNANEEFTSNLSTLDRFALWITEEVGSVGFFLIVVAWTFTWLLWNSLGPRWGRFDPYPGFVLWLFMSNVLQLVLLPLLMVGQNLSSMRMGTKNNVDRHNIEVIMKQNKEIIDLIEKGKSYPSDEGKNAN